MARKSTTSSNGQPVTTSESEVQQNDARPQRGKAKHTTAASDDSVDKSDHYTDPTRGTPMPCDASLYPGGSRSLASIGEQGFFLGAAFATSLGALIWLTHVFPHTLWRLASFTGCLSIFHFLEYETTARYNLPTLRASSFLLFTNGKEYNIAYGLAIVEMVVSYFFPAYQASFVNEYIIGSGIALVIIGQIVRTTAMVQAGTNFNHTPANTKREGHVLVTKGVYAWLRHPSYFGFFWWAVGTQLMVGNKVCLLGYIFVLWHFFSHRIRGKSIFKRRTAWRWLICSTVEEKKLVEFFGADYEDFRRRTPTGIPLVK